MASSWLGWRSSIPYTEVVSSKTIVLEKWSSRIVFFKGTTFCHRHGLDIIVFQAHLPAQKGMYTYSTIVTLLPTIPADHSSEVSRSFPLPSVIKRGNGKPFMDH